MTIADILKHKKNEIYSIQSGSKICEAIDELNNKKIGALLVTDENDKIAGILTERDILTKACRKQVQSS